MCLMYFNICCIPISGKSSHESSEVLNIVSGWEQNSGSSNLGQGGNMNHSQVNMTSTYPTEEYDPLGGHTILQVSTAWPAGHPYICDALSLSEWVSESLSEW